MSIEGAIYDRLSNYANLTALTSTRIYNAEMPQNPTYPAVVFERIDDSPVAAMGSNTGLNESRWLVYAFASTRASMIDVAAQIEAALLRYSGTHDSTELHYINQVGGQIERPTNEIWAQVTELIIFYR